MGGGPGRNPRPLFPFYGIRGGAARARPWIAAWDELLQDRRVRYPPFPKGGGGIATPTADAIGETLGRLQAGQIVAIKGLGGFHLACDARNPDAVQRLRERKQREEKPFAIMAANLASVAPWVEIGPDERAMIESPERPICLLRKRPGADAALPGIAPGLSWLGVMLPYTPIHWLLFHAAAGGPDGTAWMAEVQGLVLVMTSANPGGEPLVTGNAEAVERLAGIADAVLMHDRDIVVRCDDSVVRWLEEIPSAAVPDAAGYLLRPWSRPAPLLERGRMTRLVVRRGSLVAVLERSIRQAAIPPPFLKGGRGGFRPNPRG